MKDENMWNLWIQQALRTQKNMYLYIPFVSQRNHNTEHETKKNIDLIRYRMYFMEGLLRLTLSLSQYAI